MRLKIGITCYPTVGGSGIIATELGKMLAKKGHEIHFITSDVPFRLDKFYPNIFFHEVEVNQYAVFKYAPYDISLASKMAEVAKREKLDILHVHYAVPHAVCAYLAKEMVGDHLKIVTTLHGTDITVLGYDPSLKEVITLGIERSDAVTAVSSALVEQTADLLNPNKKIDVVYNFIDETTYYPRAADGLRESYGIASEEKVLVHISNFRQVKRVPDVIRVFEKVNQKIPAKLLLIGDGPDFRTVSSLVTELGLDERVLFLGKQENVAELLSISDLMLLLSQKESFGLVLLEAMACGVPCVGTTIGGIPEVIENGYNGYTVSLGDVEEASRLALSILQDDERARQFSKNAQLTVRERFSSEFIVSQYEKIYERTIK